MAERSDIKERGAKTSGKFEGQGSDRQKEINLRKKIDAPEASVQDEGMLVEAHKEKVDFYGKTEHFAGKKREQYHPLDRKSGTGRGREPPKHGHGKGNWGDIGDEIKLAVESTESPTKGMEEREEGFIYEEKQAAKEREEAAPLEKGINLEEGADRKLTLEEYKAQMKNKLHLEHKEPRGHDNIQPTNVQKVLEPKIKQQTIDDHLKKQDIGGTHISYKDNAELLGFQAKDEDSSAGKMEKQSQENKEGEQKKLLFDEKSFPALS